MIETGVAVYFHLSMCGHQTGVVAYGRVLQYWASYDMSPRKYSSVYNVLVNIVLMISFNTFTLRLVSKDFSIPGGRKRSPLPLLYLYFV